MVKLIATDVDGTLLKDGTFEIDPQYEQVFGQLMDKGVRVVIASGRQYKSSMKLFPNIGHRFDYVADGGATYRYNGQVEAYQRIPAEVVEELLADFAKLEDPELDISLNSSEKCYVPVKGSPMHLWLRDSYRFDVTTMEAKDKCPQDTIIKMAIYHPSNCEGALTKEFVDKWSPRLHMACAGNQWVDFVMPGINKGETLSRIEEMSGIDPKDTIVFGDNLNDLEMGGGAGKFYCVGNAREQVKEMADEILEPYWELGVLKKLKQILEEI